MDNNAAERALRAVALGQEELYVRRFGSGRRRAAIYSLIGYGETLNRDRSGALYDDVLPAHRQPSDQQDRRTVPWNVGLDGKSETY